MKTQLGDIAYGGGCWKETDILVPRQLKIDHFGNGWQGTLKNRYWINDSCYDGGPVFGARWTVPTGPFVDLSSAQSSMWGKPAGCRVRQRGGRYSMFPMGGISC